MKKTFNARCFVLKGMGMKTSKCDATIDLDNGLIQYKSRYDRKTVLEVKADLNLLFDIIDSYGMNGTMSWKEDQKNGSVIRYSRGFDSIAEGCTISLSKIEHGVECYMITADADEIDKWVRRNAR